MAKKLLQNEAAEREANDVAARFMNSADVLKDMRAEYGSRLDGVQLHDDEEAQERVKTVRRDAVARGRDVYFGRGILQSKTPEAKGLIAHEIAHTMQQDGFGGMSETVSFGEEQGGLLDKIRGVFGRGRRNQQDDIQISDPTLVSQNMMSSKDVLAMMDKATPEQMTDPKMEELVLKTFNREQSQRMRGQNLKSDMATYRDNNTTSRMMTKMMTALTPQSLINLVDQVGMMGMEGIDTAYLDRVKDAGGGHGGRMLEEGAYADQDGIFDPELGKLASLRDQHILPHIQSAVSGDDSRIGNFLAGARGSFENSAITDEDVQSGMLMSMFLNRVVTPQIDNMNRNRSKDGLQDAATYKKREHYNQSLLRGAKVEYDTGVEGKQKRFLTALRKKFR
ncbi:MAG: DUF4157 domain-containing protein [Lachnospiraceae bacterium]|nr:DUF4157 domain-containing protein [Lachnospiraceae bacterium]